MFGSSKYLWNVQIAGGVEDQAKGEADEVADNLNEVAISSDTGVSLAQGTKDSRAYA